MDTNEGDKRQKVLNSEELRPDKFMICFTICLREQDLNLRHSVYEPNIFGDFLPNFRAVDKWWTVLINLILCGQRVDRTRG